MRKWAKNIPAGMRDYLYKDVQKRRLIEKAVCGVFQSRGYNEIITPSLEFYDVFYDYEGALPPEDMYKLFDAKGRILVLRHDMTTPISRIAATKIKDGYLPLKFYYNQNVFRQNEHLYAKRDEVPQCGVELIGLSGKRADVEIIITAIESLKAATGGDFKVDIGHVGYFKEIARHFTDDEDLIEQIRQLIEAKNFAQLEKLLFSCDINQKGAEILVDLPNLFGEVDLILEAKKKAVNEKVLAILNYLEEVCESLCSLGYKEYISIDLGMVHHIHYYTGLIFRGYVKGSGENCLAGGRYDTLTQNFGKTLPATGFALNTESILDAISKRGDDPESLRPDLVIHYDEGCLKEAQEFWESRVKEGLICELSVFSDLESSREYARLRKVKGSLYHVSKNGIQPIGCREE